MELSTNKIHFGDQPNNIMAATPVDPMHAFLLGVLHYCVKIYIAYMTASEKVSLNQLIYDLFKSHLSSKKTEYTRFSFTRGITNLTTVTAEEWEGMAYALVLAHLTEEGAAIFETFYNRRIKKDTKKDPADLAKAYKNAHVDDEIASNTVLQPDTFIHIMEMMLCFHAFYRSGVPIAEWEEQDVEEQLPDALEKMMENIKKHLPCTNGHG